MQFSHKKPLYEVSFEIENHKKFESLLSNPALNSSYNKKYDTNNTMADTMNVIQESQDNNETKETETHLKSQIKSDADQIPTNISLLTDNDDKHSSSDEFIELNPGTAYNSYLRGCDATIKYFSYNQHKPRNIKTEDNIGFKYTMRNSKIHNSNNKNDMSGSKTQNDTNLYESRIDIKALQYDSKQFELMGVNYYSVNYMQDNNIMNFSAAVIPKNTKKAKDYLIEIQRQNSLNLDIFIRPILYFYEQNFQHVLYPFLKRKIMKVEKSNKSVFNNIKDILNMMRILHSNRVAFRTLTTDNLFSQNRRIKQLRTVNLAHSHEIDKKKICRTPVYQILHPLEFNPPEIFERGWCSEKADIWALGCMMFLQCNGYLPFNSNNYDFNIHIKSYYIAKFKKQIPIEQQILIRSMLEFDPTHRPGIQEILIEKWQEEQLDVLKQNDIEIERKITEKKENQSKGWSWLKDIGNMYMTCSTNLIGKLLRVFKTKNRCWGKHKKKLVKSQCQHKAILEKKYQCTHCKTCKEDSILL